MWAPLGAFGLPPPLLLLLLLPLAPACDNLCVRHSDCPLDYVCRPDGLCELPPAPPPPDAEPIDAGPDHIPDMPDAAPEAADASQQPDVDAAGNPADASGLADAS